MHRQICDYCGEPWPRNQITLTRRPNDDETYAELCQQCTDDIVKYATKVEESSK